MKTSYPFTFRFTSALFIGIMIALSFHSVYAGDSEDTVEKIGDVLQIALPAGAGVTTVVLNDWEGTKQFAMAFGASWATTYALKAAMGKMRPNGTARNSFPSGHTMGAFAGAAFFDNRYGHAVGYPAYGLAVFTAYSRVVSDWNFLMRQHFRFEHIRET